MAKESKSNIASKQKYNGDTEYYFKKAPQKTTVGKIVILVLAGLMILVPVVGLIIALL